MRRKIFQSQLEGKIYSLEKKKILFRVELPLLCLLETPRLCLLHLLRSPFSTSREGVTVGRVRGRTKEVRLAKCTGKSGDEKENAEADYGKKENGVILKRELRGRLKKIMEDWQD